MGGGGGGVEKGGGTVRIDSKATEISWNRINTQTGVPRPNAAVPGRCKVYFLV